MLPEGGGKERGGTIPPVTQKLTQKRISKKKKQ